VLEWLIAERGDLPDQIRVIESLGPSPIPPWVVSKRLQATVRSELRALLLCIHMETRGRALLRRAGLGRFVAAEDRDYDPIREMAKKAERVSLA
jgi:phosphonate transport system substrate-binding protein